MQSTALRRLSFLMMAGVLLTVLVSATAATAQTTALTYQGRLTDGATVATGVYQMQFVLFDAIAGGNQIGGTLTFDGVGANPSVQVNNGVFTVELDFGANPFVAGAARYLEIAVKKPADASYTPLAPRQQLTSSPYAVRTLSAGTADALSTACVGCVSNAQIATVDGSKVTGTVANATNANTATSATNANNLGNVAASQYVQTTDSRLSDARPASSINFGTATLTGTLPLARGGTGVTSSGASGNFLRSNGSIWTSSPLSSSDLPSGSGSYIQNTFTQQTGNFNISGTGTLGGTLTAGAVNASSSSNLILLASSSSNIGTWLRFNNTSTGGHNWNLISTGSSNSEGAGKLIFNDQTSGGTRLEIDSTGTTAHGNLAVTGDATVGGNLTVGGTVNSLVPTCKALQAASQSVPNGVFVNIQFDNTAFCSGVTFDNPNDRLVIVTPGVYLVTAEILFLGNGNGIRFLSATTSSSGEIIAYSAVPLNGVDTGMNGTGMVRLSAGDTVSLQGAQSSGGSLSTAPFSGRSASLSLTWVAP
jgi:hypothetical protein